MRNQLLLISTSLMFALSCTNDPNKPYNDNTTSGTVKIAADETLSPFVNAEKDTFMGLYRYSTLKISTKPESECFNDLLSDSVKVIVSSRKLTAQEEKVFQARNLIPVTTKIAYDAIALIINKENPDSLININQLTSVLTGQISSWKKLNTSSKLDSINVVFDNNGSSNIRYLNDSLLKGKQLSSNCFAVNSNKQVIDYVEKNKNAIGIIGVSWISDSHDPAAQQFLSQINVMWIAPESKSSFPNDYFKPFQAYIATKEYPLIREIYIISREGRSGLGTGFVAFVAGEQGQRVVRLSGLLPATMPIRLIKTD